MTTTLGTAPTTAPATERTVAAPAQTLSIISLVLGISSIVFGLTFIIPAAAVVVGIVALNREPAGKKIAIWGIVTGAIMLAGVLPFTVGLAFLAPLGFLFSGLFW